MCETNAFLVSGSEEELLLDNVDIIRPEDGRVYLRNLFGEEKLIEGSIREISLSRHRIVVERKK